MKKNILLLGLLLTICLSGCDSFLEEPAMKNGDLPRSVNELLAFYNSMFRKNNCNYRTFISDDATIPFTQQDAIDNVGTYQKRLLEFRSAFFRRDLRRYNSDGGGRLWASEYSTINTENYILSMADDKTLEGTSEERERLKAYAKFTRAMSYFDLVTSFSLPYCPGKNDDALGVVLKEGYSLEMTEKNLKRSTLKETYDYIEKDLKESMDAIPDGDEKWKITKKAVYAFAARFYLMIGNCQEAKKYAELALIRNSALIDYTKLTTRTVQVNNGPLNVVSYFYDITTYDDATVRNIPENYYIEVMDILGKPCFPTQDLINLYVNDGNNDDVRLWNMPPEAGVRLSRYINNRSNLMYRYYGGIGSGQMLTSPNVPEMMLIMAECCAEANDLAQAKQWLNKLREKRIINYNPSKVNSLADKDQVLHFIYDERRRERPFFLRSLDIRRLNAIKNANINITKNFFDMSTTKLYADRPMVYELKAGDNAYADYIFEDDIALSDGYLQQNQ